MSEIDIANEVIGRAERAWNCGDGEAFGDAYVDDATFVTVRGDYLCGRRTIAAGHARIFATIYLDSVNTMEILNAVTVRDGVILAVTRNTLDVPTGPLAGVRQAMSTNLLTSQFGEWRIRSTHNTIVERAG